MKDPYLILSLQPFCQAKQRETFPSVQLMIKANDHFITSPSLKKNKNPLSSDLFITGLMLPTYMYFFYFALYDFLYYCCLRILLRKQAGRHPLHLQIINRLSVLALKPVSNPWSQ